MEDAECAIALREWACVCTALGHGSTIAVVRKGGIHEPRGGLFVLAHQRFLLLPGYEHQDPARVVPSLATIAAETDPNPGRIAFRLLAEPAAVWKVTDAGQLPSLSPHVAVAEGELQDRFAYRGKPWLFAVALRVWQLPAPVLVDDRPAYAGCRSWVPLQEAVSTTGARPVLAQADFDALLRPLIALLGRPGAAPAI